MVECADFLRIDIKAGYRKTVFTEEQRQRQANIAQADNPDSCRPRLDARAKLLHAVRIRLRLWGHLSRFYRVYQIFCSALLALSALSLLRGVFISVLSILFF